MDEPLFGLGVQVEVLKDELCDIDPEDDNMPNCLLPGEGGQLDDGEFPLTSINRQGNIGLQATRPICRFSRAWDPLDPWQNLERMYVFTK